MGVSLSPIVIAMVIIMQEYEGVMIWAASQINVLEREMGRNCGRFPRPAAR